MSSTFSIENKLHYLLLKWRYTFAFGFILFFSSTSFAQRPTIQSSLDKYKILIGEPITLHVETTYSPDVYNLQWFVLPDSVDHFEVIERKKPDSVESNGQLKVSQSIVITSFDSGLRSLPPLQVSFRSKADNAALDLLTESFKVQVAYSPADSVLPFHDIKTIIAVKDEWPLWMKIAAILSALLVIFLIYYLIKNRKKKQPAKKVALPKPSAIDEAIQALNTLEKSALLSSGQTKQFHTTLTKIFKTYSSRKFDESIDKLTTDELLLRLNNKQISRDMIAITANSFKMADAVKFAKFQPTVEESAGSLINVRKVISDIEHKTLNVKSDN
ncbi:MAG: hypothetical protein ABIR81_00600 [Ginsengibacter sp.]